MKTPITEQQAMQLIRQNSGKFFSVDFIKRDGTRRKLNGRTGVIKYLKGTGTTKRNPSNVVVWDRKIKDYRSFNIDTLVTLNIGGKEYYIEPKQ